MTTLRWWLEPPRIHLLTIGWALLILGLSATPGRELPELTFEGLDKIAHAGVYAILAFLMCYSMRSITAKRGLVLVFLACTLYGLGIEWMQGTFFEGRFFDLWDGLANSVGAVLGIVIFSSLS